MQNHHVNTYLLAAAGAPSGRLLQITAESKGSTAAIRIIGAISNWNENNGKDFTRLVDELLKKNNEAHVYLNTEGGSVFEANEMVNQLKRFKSVTITVGALCASAGTYFAACFTTSAYSNSQFMIHKPMLITSGNEDEVERDLKMLRNTTDAYKKAYAKKMGITEDEVETLWSKGDYWMTAQEAKEKGLIDAILEDEEEITSQMAATLVACGAPKLYNVQEPKTKNTFMEREELIAFLGLAADATDAQIEAAKTQMKVNALKHQQAETAAKATTEAEKTAKAKTLVEAALTAKKITAEQVAHFEKFATADYAACEATLNSMTGIPKLTDEISTGGAAATEATRKDWTLDDYLEKDPEAYQTMLTKAPEKAAALEAAYFGTKK